MATIDLRGIRGHSPGGQRASFEEFVCQLAHEDPIGVGAEFRRVHGTGGDGGVEAYWLRNDGSTICYQAKYFTHVHDIGWRQVDASVRQALKSHAEMTTYTVALPCDFTARSGAKRRGKTGWEHWETHRKKWVGWAEKNDLTVEFRVWTAFELQRMALQQLRPGAIRYWFDETLLDRSWFEAKANRAITDLGVRYSPLVHVKTQVQECYEAFVHHDALRARVASCIGDFWSRHGALRQLLDSADFGALTSLLMAATEGLDQLPRDVFPSDVRDSRTADATSGWLGGLARVDACLQDMRSMAGREDATQRAVREIDGLREALMGIREVLNQGSERFGGASGMLLSGRFGTGKSHAMGTILSSSVDEGRPAVLFLGQQFNDSNPRHQMLQMAGFAPDVSWEDFLDGFNAASVAANKIGLMLIDAINEGAGGGIWPNHIAGILAEIAERPALRAIVSCRTEYKARVWTPSPGVVEFELRNFTEAEFEGACVRLMDERGIARPIDAFMPPEFYNPLILSTACESLNVQGISEFPGSLGGLSSYVDLYVDGVAHDIKRRYHVHGPLAAAIELGLLALAERSLEHPLLEQDARSVLQDAINRAAPEGTEWLDVLLGVGALRLDPHPSPPAWQPHAEVARFAFQVHEEEFRARALLRRAGSSRQPFNVGEPLESVRRDIEAPAAGNSIVWHDWRGVIMALSVLWAREHGDEIIDAIPSSSGSAGGRSRLRALVRVATYDGFLWRRAEHVTDRTTKLLGELPEAGDTYAVLVKFIAVVGHPWNAVHLDRQLTAFGDCAARDADWTVAMNQSEAFEAAIHRHIEWALRQNEPFADGRMGELAAVGLAWFLSTTNRFLRDRATKALVHLLRLQPAMIGALLQRFRAIDDLYILERLLAAIYGACCTLDAAPVGLAAAAVYDEVFEPGPPAHLLLRDYGLGVLERAKFLDVLPSHVDMGACMPPHSTDWPLDVHSNQSVDDLATALGDAYGQIAQSCTTEYGRGTGQYGDFGRYTLESLARRFLPVPLTRVPSTDELRRVYRWNGEVIGNWVAWRAYNLGWRSSLFPTDRTQGEYVGRSRGKIERIGKKYQWIALYELLGTMSDHVWCERRFSLDEAKRYHSALDIPFSRDIDPTLVSPEAFDTPACYSMTGLEVDGLGGIAHPDWPFTDESLVDLRKAAAFTTVDGRRWYRLYARTSEDAFGDRGEASFLSFATLRAVCVPVSELDGKVARWDGQLKQLFFDTEPATLTGEEFLYEFGWRETQDRTTDGEPAPYLASEGWPKDAGEFLPLVWQYRWEHGADGSLPDGAASHLLVPWVTRGAGLEIDPGCPTTLRKNDGGLGSFSFDETQGSRGNAACVICAEAMDRLLDERGLVCIWVFGGERIMSRGGRSGGRRRFFSGMGWFEADEFQSRSSLEDRGS